MGYIEKYSEIPITFERGLVETVEDSMLPPGSVAKLVNWESDPTGNLRARIPWVKGSTTGAPSTRKGWGIGTYSQFTRPRTVQSVSIPTTTGCNATNHTITLNWSKATTAGNTLVLKLILNTSTQIDLTVPFVLPTGWQLIFRPAEGSTQNQSVYAIKEDAASESSVVITFSTTSGNPCYYTAHLIEYANIVDKGTVKNILPSMWASFEGPCPLVGFTYTNLTLTSPRARGSAYEGVSYLQGVTVASGDFSWTSPTGTSGFPVSPSTTYVVSGYRKHQTGTTNQRFDILWYTSAGTYISTTTGSSSGSTASYTRLETTGTSPSNAAYAAICGYNASVGAGSFGFTWDAMQFEIGSTATALSKASISTALIGWANTGGTGTTVDTGTASAPTVPVYQGDACVAQDSISTFSAQTSGWTEKHDDDNNTCALVAWNKLAEKAANERVQATSTLSSLWGGCIILLEGKNYGLAEGVFAVAQNDTTEFKIYTIDRSSLSGGSWTLLDTITASPDVVSIAFTSGNNYLFYVHPSFSGVRAWNGFDAPSAIATSPAGRCIAWHKDRLFVGGTAGEPWKLHYSEQNDHTNWTTGTAGFIPVNTGDGEAIEDITPFEGGLLIGKQTGLWMLTGSGPNSFRLIKVGEAGCAPGRTITPTRNGAMIAGRTSIYVYRNGSIAPVSTPIADSYGMTGNWMSGAVYGDRYSILDQGSGTIWTLNLIEGTWRTETMSSPTTEAPGVLYNWDNKFVMTPKSGTVGGFLNYKLVPGTTRGKDYDTLSETFEAWTPEIWALGPQEKLTPRYLFLKLRQRGGDASDTGLTVTPVYDGRTQAAKTIPAFASAGVYWTRVSVGHEAGVSSFQFRFSQTLPSGDASVFDIEEVVLGFLVEEYR